MHRHQLIHSKCGKVAFYYDHAPVTGEILRAESATFPDGTRPREGDKAVCGHCGEALTRLDLQSANIKPVPSS